MARTILTELKCNEVQPENLTDDLKLLLLIYDYLNANSTSNYIEDSEYYSTRAINPEEKILKDEELFIYNNESKYSNVDYTGESGSIELYMNEEELIPPTIRIDIREQTSTIVRFR